MTHDVVVIGAGPAGAVASREIARRGASVLLVDRSDFPRRKVCGGCLSAGALDVLDSLGLGGLPSALGGEPLERLVLSAGSRSARLRLERGCALSRSTLDEGLVGAAREEGVEFRPGGRASLGRLEKDRRVVHLERFGSRTILRARVVLDATGLGGRLVDAGHAGSDVRLGCRIGLGATFDDPRYPVQPGSLHMVVGRTGYVGLVRVESGVLNVAAALDPGALRGSTPARAIADLLTSAGAQPLSPARLSDWRGTPTLRRRPVDVASERLFRVGDAQGYVEPFTGEGMCWALSAAVAVAPLAVEGAQRWDPTLSVAWRRYDAEGLGKARRLCRLLTAAIRRPRLVETALAALAFAPGLARPVVRKAAAVPRLGPVYAP